MARTHRQTLGVIISAALMGLTLAGMALAASDDGYALVRTAAVPAATLAGGSYRLTATVSQPDAGSMQGGLYTLGGGFWGGESLPSHDVYLPLVLR